MCVPCPIIRRLAPHTRVIIPNMHIRFTKMQGAGNDFVVLDETQGRLGLTTAQYRFLADRHFGVGADQILTVRPSPAPGRSVGRVGAQAALWQGRNRQLGARPP